jgi:hypothetical protein
MSHHQLWRSLLVVGVLTTAAFSKPAADVSSAITPIVAGSAVAFSCDRCSDGGFGGMNEHQFASSGAFFDCQVFNACHGNTQTGWCGEWHCPCNAISCPPPQEAAITGASNTERAVSVDVVANAARNDDVRELSGILRRNGDVVRYNPTRGVVQLLGCGQEVVAQVPVSAAIAVALD